MTDTNQEVRETCPKPGCGARKIIGHPCLDWDCPQQTLTAAEHRAALATALASAPPPAVPDAVGVRVKGLTWEVASDADYGDPLFAQAWVAAGLKGFYRLERRMDSQFTVWFPLEGFGQMFAAEAEAKAAAQADFDRRILSSIEPTPSPEPQADKFRSVLERIKFRLHFMGWPAEPMWNVGSAENPLWRADWRYEIDLLENALHGATITSPEKPTDTIRRNQVPASPEPQASNAGAVEALRSCIEVIDDYLAYRHDGDPYREDARIMGEMEINRFARDGRLKRARDALTTPEPQTGERDGEIKAWLMGDPVTGQWIEVDGHRVAYSRGMGRPVHVLAEAFKTELARADTAEGNVNRWKARAEIVEQERIADLKLLEAELAGTKDLLRIANDQIERLGKPMNDAVAPWQALLAGAHARAEAAERRPAEVEERAREDERDARRYRHLRDNHVRRWTSNMGGPDSLDIGFDANGHDLDAALDAALRAKPEAQAIVGKEAQS